MNEAMTQGVELMLTGMGIVFLFLVLLIVVVKLIAYCVATFIPEVKVASVSAALSQAVSCTIGLASNGEPRRSRAFKYTASSYTLPVCQQR